MNEENECNLGSKEQFICVLKINKAENSLKLPVKSYAEQQNEKPRLGV